MERILGIDFGEKRTGFAISDELGLIAHGLPTFQKQEKKGLIPHLNNIINENKIKRIIIGFPKMMSGTLGEKAETVRKFAEDIKREFKIPVILWDERLSSVQSRNILRQMSRKYLRQKERIDQLSAVLILQSYLDYLKRQK